MKKKLKEFKASSLYPAFMVWGNGHTTATDPMRRGWRARYIKGCERVLLVGIQGIEGCFSMVPGSKKLHIAAYLETPETVAKAKRQGDYVDANYHTLADASGWGLEAIRLLREEMIQLGYDKNKIPQ